MKSVLFSRMLFLYGAIFFVAFLLISKLVFVQIINGKDFSKQAEQQYIQPAENVYNRGTIYFKKKDGTLFQAATDGIGKDRNMWRFYPGGTLAAHLLGFVGYKDEAFGGRYGVERYYEDVLIRDETELSINFFAEVFANIRQSIFYDTKSRQGDVILTIEPEVQRFLEIVFGSLVDKWSAESGGAIIINPQTGEIYALAAEPTFDPNNFKNVDNYLVFSNPLVENIFEMGSIMKPLTLTFGLDAGVITPESRYYDTGSIVIGDDKIENYDGKARGTVLMQEILNQSLNTGAVYVMRKMGGDVFRDYIIKSGLGEETGIDLPNEVHGLINNLMSGREIEYATASFGQGIAVTPVAMTRALGALANGGVVVTPHVADRIEYKFRPDKKVSYGDERRILSEESAEEVTRMLVHVVDTKLLEGAVKIPNYSVAAKTGTAQLADMQVGGYYDNRFLHSFFGYFPAYDPQFLLFFYIIDPQGVRYASQTLTHPFIDMVKFLINYYDIPPDR